MFGGAAVVDGMGLLHGVSSYCGELMISVVSDREMLPDPSTYAECIDRSFAELSAATREPKAARRRPARRRPARRRPGPALVGPGDRSGWTATV